MHEGHRQRMYSKLESGENLFDHEILEILLYAAFPRVNTNPIAHNLLDRFGTLSNVLSASKAELKSVENVGEQTANFLGCVGECCRRVGKTETLAKIATYGDFKHFAEMRLKGRTDEYLEFYLLDKCGNVLGVYSYSSAKSNAVTIKLDDIARSIARVAPATLLVAHNHPNGLPKPSDEDVKFTKAIQIVCNMHGVDFRDHLIYADGGFYSFLDDGIMDEIKYKCSLDKLI